MTSIVEPSRNIPIAYDVDVVVAGAGTSGIFAALAAARKGAKTVIIDRFGSPGGNIGPGYFGGGSLTGWPGTAVVGGLAGIAREFVERHAANGGGAVPPYSEANFWCDGNVVSYTATKMLEESGVTLMLSSFAGDPILEGRRVGGLFVENKSGRQAVAAKVVIDATGEADVVRRAGGAVYYPDPQVKEKGRTMGLNFLVAAVDWDRHDAVDEAVRGKRSEEALGQAKQNGTFDAVREVAGLGTIQGFGYSAGRPRRCGFATGYLGVNWPDHINQGDGHHISRLEAEMRKYCFETAQFWKKTVPGFEDSYLVAIAPFLGSRGGPAIEGDVTLTQADIDEGRRFDDVIFVCGANAAKPLDFPYRALLPRDLDGVLAAGRSAGRRPGSLLRSRPVMMHSGQAAGTAAAIAAEGGLSPRQIDVKQLQRALVDAGFYLGDLGRLKQLSLI